MPWFKADDQLSRSKKVLRIPRRYRMPAMGLWILAGTWAAGELTDGFVPAHMLDELGGSEAMARRLVASGLWSETAEGFLFNSWDEFQPSSEEVRERRARDAERKREAREKKRRDALKRSEQRKRESVQADSEETDRGVRVESERSPQSVRSTRPDPARPDPTRPTSKEGRGESSRSVPRENATPPPSSDSSWLPSAIADVPPAWVQDPRSARCPKHTGVQDPPPCRGCGKAREVAEAARDERDAAEAQAAGERRALIDACDLCDPNGLTDGPGGLIRCPHDNNALSALLSAEDHPGAPEPEPVEKTTPRALRDWRHRHANRVETLGSETVLPAIDHNDHEPTHEVWDEDAS